MENPYSDIANSKIKISYLLLPIYEDFLIKKAKNNDRTFSHFHPSSFGGCIRKILLQYYGEENKKLKEKKEIIPRVERIFDAGHSYHRKMQEHLGKIGILRGKWRSKLSGKIYGAENPIGIFMPLSLKEINEEHLLQSGDNRNINEFFEYEEISLENQEYNFKGNCDGIIEINKDDPETRYVVDFKTCKTEKYRMIATRIKKPSPEYITQITIYMWLSGVHKGIIFYEDKNTHNILEFHVGYSETRVDRIKKTAKKILNFIQKKQIFSVPSHYKKTKIPCLYCEYSKICFNRKI